MCNTQIFKHWPNKACVLVDLQVLVPLLNVRWSQATRPLMIGYLEHYLLSVSVLRQGLTLHDKPGLLG